MATLTTLESFTGGDDGGSPGYGSLLMDANGNLFGTTLSGGPAGGGTVFELVNTGSGFTLQTLATFDPNDTVNGNTPFAGLTMDASGNLFGVTQAGGASGSGTVFELANTGSGYGQLQTLTSFSGAANGAYPMGTLLADGAGDLFGTTQSGGVNGQGTVFEMVKGASGYSLQTIYQFNFTDGAAPTGALIADGNGDLFGTTAQGGTGSMGQGTVFELVHGASGYTLQTLASFDGSNGSFLYAGVVADAQGNLFGATYSGGANGYGTIYELVNTGSGFTYQTLATLDYNVTGGYSIGGLTTDAQGDVFGTALAGGANAFGTVFELVHGSSGYTFQTLYAFGGSDGAMPEGALMVDTAGNLYGTTAGGGANGAGTVFEIASAAPSNEQAQLALKVNDGLGSPIGAAGEHGVAFTVAGLEPGDTGVVTFTDAANNTVTVNVAAGQTHYTADFAGLTDGAVSASLQVATNNLGVSFDPVTGNTVTLDTVAPGRPGAPADGAVSGGYVNGDHDTAGQTIGGTAEAGAVVAVYDNGTQVATVTADGTGAWSYQVGALADGSSHSYAVTATDAAGNVSPMSAALSFTVDASPPAQPAAPADGAVSNGYINAAHDVAGQTISGTTEAGATVAVYDNGTQVGAVTADGSGAWSYHVGALADGSAHSYAVTATDAAGNTSAMSAALSFTVDTSAPGQPAAPADAAVHNGYVNAAHDTAAQTISGVTEAGASVAVFDNGTHVATVTADGAGAWSYQVGVLADGAHSFAATATDAAGNASAMGAALSFTVITAEPDPSTPVDAAVSNGYLNAAHDTAAQTISGTADPDATIAVYDNGAQVATVTADGTGAWSYKVGVLADGSAHSYAVTATDAAGNTSPMSPALSFTVDTSAPGQPGTPGDASVSGGFVNAAHDTAGQTIGGTAEAGASVVIYDNGALVTTVAANGSGAWSYQVGALADGSSHSYAVTATDAAGNTSVLSQTLSFSVDTSAPVSAVAGVAVGGDGAATVSGSAEAGSTVTLYDGASVIGAVTAGAGGTWSYPVGVLAAGSGHSYTVTATDAAGNTSAPSGALSYTAPSGPSDPPADPPPQPATPTDAAAHNGWVNAAGDTASQTIGGTAVAGDHVTLYDQGSKVTTVTADGTGAWSYQVGVLANGSSHSYTVTDTDGGGNVSPMSGALAFTVDTAAPAAPTGLADASIVNGYVNKANDTAGQSLTGHAEAGSVVTVYDNGTKIGATTANASTGAWSFNLNVLADGVQSLTTTATDAAGNTSAMSQALSFTVDATAPVPAVTNVTDAGKGMSTLSGTSEAGSTVTVFDGGQQVGVATTAANGTWSLTLKLNGGQTHQFTETAVDLAGNTGASTGSGYWANPANKAFTGGTGDDVFIGQKGDSFTCGSGHDHLVFNAGFGREDVSNFASGSDQIWLDHTVFGSVAAVMANALRMGGDTLISTSSGDQLLLHGVLPTGLHAGDFHFF
jgi:uncharacterized repeat protein (TIGR03803 family)